MTTAAQKPLRVFCSYSRKDEEHLNDLRDWLRGLERQGFIESWHDREIVPGWEWEEAIDKNLRTADMILLLVSTPFMASDYVYEKEIGKAVERHERGEARVIPIIVRPAYWKWATFGRLQALPKDAKPITTWLNRDEAWLDVVEGIQKAVEELWAERQEQFASERYREEELARRVAAIYDDGQQHIDAKEWQQALECFEEIQRLQSNHFEASFGKGVALHSLGRDQEALEAYDKVISLDPDYAEAWLNMGDALDNVERHQEASEAYDKAKSLDSD
jgi:tetratricopeptide (TPR) repeat protein